MKKYQNRTLKLILGQHNVTLLSGLNILLVGAGGIGCEVVKNISRLGVLSLTILDFDTIEQTNLNRQFYFRKDHIGLSKAYIIKEMAQKLAPNLNITAINGNIYNKQFNDLFYDQFDLIISALDSMKTRQHLAAQATRNGKPFVDAGTMSYHGQAYATIRFLTTCHNCNPLKNYEETGAVCLVRSRPERPIHCCMYAKSFYESFFGGKGDIMSQRLKPERFLTNEFDVEDENQLDKIGRVIFSELFYLGIMDVDNEGIHVARKLKLEEVLGFEQIVHNPESTMKINEFEKQKKTPYIEQQLWSLKRYAQSFLFSMTKLIKRKFLGKIPAQFQKDDEDCMLLVNCITNLRTYNFINMDSSINQLKYLTYYECKDLIGKIMPAIASANAIAAALEIRQIIKIATKRLDRLRVVHFTNQGQERLSPCFSSQPLISCNFCSGKVIYARVQLDMDKVLFGQFQKFAQMELFSFGRDLYSGPFALIKNNKQTQSPNKLKPISFVKEMVHEGVLSVCFRAGLKGTPITVHISIVHKEGAQDIRTVKTPSKSQLKLQLLHYFRKIYENNTQLIASEEGFYGTNEL